MSTICCSLCTHPKPVVEIDHIDLPGERGVAVCMGCLDELNTAADERHDGFIEEMVRATGLGRVLVGELDADGGPLPFEPAWNDEHEALVNLICGAA